MTDDSMPDSAPLLTAKALRVGQGERVVLDDVELQIHAGEIFGIVGRARSGKTALLETLMGLRPPLSGTVTLLGSRDPSSMDVRQHVGSSLRPSTVERRTTVQEAVRFCASLYDRHVDLEALIREVGLWHSRAKYREDLAPHELARLSLAMGLVSNPRVLFADEPTRELDPEGRQQVWEVLRSRRNAGAAVILSTNLMDEAERLCDRIAILGNRRILAVDTPAGIVAAGEAPSRMTIDTVPPLSSEALAQLLGVGSVRIDGPTARLLISDPVAAVCAVAGLLRDGGVELRSLRFAQATLEDRFAELTRAGADADEPSPSTDQRQGRMR